MVRMPLWGKVMVEAMGAAEVTGTISAEATEAESRRGGRALFRRASPIAGVYLSALLVSIAPGALAQSGSNPLSGGFNLDLSHTQTVESNAPRFTIVFSGYSTSLDIAGQEVVSIIAELARDSRAPLIEIVSNPDGVAGDRDDLAGSRALNVRLALTRAGTPKETRIEIVSNQRGSLPSLKGGSSLLQEDQRVEVIVHEDK